MARIRRAGPAIADEEVDVGYVGNYLLRAGYREWFHFFFAKIEKRKFLEEPIHQDLFDVYDAIHRKELLRLVINIPPRSGKTTISVYFIAYCLAANPRCNFIYTSYSQELLSDNSRRLSTILNDPLYRDMYSQTASSEDIPVAVPSQFWRKYYAIENSGALNITAKKIVTAAGGVVLFNSIGSALTGFGAGMPGEGDRFCGAIIIDDAQKPIEAHSERMREKVKSYFSETLLSRVNSSSTPIINVQQRLHVDDLSGHLYENYNFALLKRPLLDTEGRCTIPSQYDERRLQELQKNQYLFQSQYQQEPIRLGGNLIKRDWFRFYDAAPERFKELFITCDTAFSTKTSADNSVFMLAGISEDNRLYVLDMDYGKMDFPELKKRLEIFYRRVPFTHGRFSPVSAIYIENKASGQSLIQELKSVGLPIRQLMPTVHDDVLNRNVNADKFTRYLEVSTDLECGYVFLPKNASWLDLFLRECEVFDGRGGYHDDMVDCLIYALKIRRTDLDIDWGASLLAFSSLL